MTNPSSKVRPLVTFALFAYNQEQYIREAVEGAFSQTYEPLEIILSDDCSSDRTFEIMQEMAADYVGLHEVRVRQNEVNNGTLRHVITVAHEAKGEILVVAAGDDISLPERTEILISKFTSPEIAAISSDDIVIDKSGIEQNWHEERIRNRDCWHKKKSSWILGATAAYRSDLFNSLPMPNQKILNEDTTMQEVLIMKNKTSLHLKEKLIKRRSHVNNISFKVSTKTTLDLEEDKRLVTWRRVADVYSYCSDAAILISKTNNQRISKKYKRASRYFLLLSSWPDLSIFKRIELIFLAIVEGKLKKCLPRMFGTKTFFMLKNVKVSYNKQKQ